MEMYTKKIGRALLLSSFCMAVLAVVLGQDAMAQRIVTVDPGFATLNVAIDSDTTSTGARVDSNTVYVLESGGLYLLDGSIEHRNYHLSIVAEDGWTERPKLQPATDGQGGGSSRAFRPRGSLTLKGLYVTNEDELGGLNTRIIRVSESEVTISLDNCVLEKDGQTAFRFDGDDINLYMTNSVVKNIGSTSSPDNGRVIDDRGNDIGTLYLENNTFYNITSQVLRDDGGIIKNAYINQNTVYNSAKNTTFEFGHVIKGSFTNNLMVNSGFLGDNKNDDETQYNVKVDSLTPEEVTEFGEQSFTISNNNIMVESAITAAYPDSAQATTTFNSTVEAYITEQNSASTNLNEAITFTNAPETPTTIVTDFWAQAAEPTEFSTTGAPFDFGYTSSANSFTGGSNGQQIGSLFWHGGITTSNEDEVINESPNAFVLKGNYPNPFNPSTNIAFDLDSPSNVSIEVFSVIGQKVMSIPAQRMNAGVNQSIQLNATGLSSGMYIYRVTAKTASNTLVNTGRMTLIK